MCYNQLDAPLKVMDLALSREVNRQGKRNRAIYYKNSLFICSLSQAPAKVTAKVMN